MPFKKHTIGKDIFISTALLSLIILASFSILLSILLFQTGYSKAVDIIKQRNYAVNYYIDGYFAEINNTIEILSFNTDVQNFLNRDKAANERVRQLFRLYREINRNISFIYSAYDSGELIINDYVPPENFDPRTRPWYIAARENQPYLSSGVSYREAKSGEWLLSTSKALYDEENNFSGVISCDSSIEMVMDILRNQRDEVYNSSYSYVINPAGNIILHHDKSLITTKLSDLTGKTDDFKDQEGLFRYSLGDLKKIAYYSRCDEADWIVVTVVNVSEITDPIIRRIALFILLIGFISLVVGAVLSTILSRRFSRPLRELRHRVIAVINGRNIDSRSYDFPENEIGYIAGEIEQLATDELYRKTQELEKKNIDLAKLSRTDQLTGLYNRRKMDEEISRWIQSHKRYKRPFSMILIDVDYFKSINDNFGHQAGDAVLKELAYLIRKNLRPTDLACRWGGEEFLILCNETSLDQAEVLGQRLGKAVEKNTFSVNCAVTISGGISEYRDLEDFDTFVKRVDENLYKAKGEGRNRIISSS